MCYIVLVFSKLRFPTFFCYCKLPERFVGWWATKLSHPGPLTTSSHNIKADMQIWDGRSVGNDVTNVTNVYVSFVTFRCVLTKRWAFFERINLTRPNFRRINTQKIARTAEIPHLSKLLSRRKGGTIIGNAWAITCPAAELYGPGIIVTCILCFKLMCLHK